MTDPVVIDNTPNVAIKNPEIRFQISLWLFLVGLVAAIAAVFFSFFPELAFGTDLPTRIIGFTNAVLSLIANAFGLTVLVPNIPRKAGHVGR